MRKDILEKREQIDAWVLEKRSKGFMCRELACRADTLNYYLRQFGIKYNGNQGNVGYRTSSGYITAEEYLRTAEFPLSSRLRKKLIRDGIKDNRCEECGISEWNGQTLTIELHHVDGNHHNNEICNLMMLCPNCHSLTPNHSMRKKDK